VSIRIRKKTQVQIEFGKRLKTKRQELGFTQEQLAEKAGLTHSYLGSIERGERNVSLGNIVALAKALMISPQELIPNLEQQNQVQAKIELGKHLKSKRLERGWTQQELALKAKLTVRDIELFERGEGIMSFDALVVLAKALKISLKGLIPETGF
jgi:transcriptional regulator with XRE-family HTH domain